MIGAIFGCFGLICAGAVMGAVALLRLLSADRKLMTSIVLRHLGNLGRRDAARMALLFLAGVRHCGTGLCAMSRLAIGDCCDALHEAHPGWPEWDEYPDAGYRTDPGADRAPEREA